MQFKIIAVGELKGWSKLAYDDYAKRVAKPYSVDATQIATPRRAKNADKSAAIKLETQKISKCLKPDDYVIALDQHGKMLSTELFHDKLNVLSQNKRICFLLGGPDGLSDEILKRAHLKLSLSQMVLPHALARVMLIEQIYRSYTLTTNHPYHRE